MISIILVLLSCVLSYYFWMKCKYSYWTKMGVKGPTPLPFVGNAMKFMTLQQSLGDFVNEIHLSYPREKVVGFYIGSRKAVVIRDPDILKSIVTKDFKYFPDRGFRTNEGGFSNNVLISEGDIWKSTRLKLTPIFSKVKLKLMTPLIQECIDKFVTQTENRIDTKTPCNIQNLCEKYSTDIICSCVFGFSLDVYNNGVNFEDISKLGAHPDWYLWLWNVAEMLLPGIQKKFSVAYPSKLLQKIFLKMVATVNHERKTRVIKRNDLINTMLELKEKQEMEGVGSDGISIDVDDNFIASQLYAFNLAGQDTAASVLALMLYELSLHRDVQDAAYREICQVYDKFDGFTYDSLKEMRYLYTVLLETLRMYPVISYLVRQAASDYMIPGTQITIEADTIVLISLSGLHYDAQYFKDPEKFNPDNFSAENIESISQYVYMPFGAGPRNCIGKRLAETHIMLAVASFLKKFILKPSSSKEHQVNYNNTNDFVLTAKSGIWMNISKR